jgi:hypothetical protein
MTMGDRIRPSRTPGTASGGPDGQPVQHPAPPPHRPGDAADTPRPAINPTPGLGLGLGQRAK